MLVSEIWFTTAAIHQMDSMASSGRASGVGVCFLSNALLVLGCGDHGELLLTRPELSNAQVPSLIPAMGIYFSHSNSSLHSTYPDVKLALDEL